MHKPAASSATEHSERDGFGGPGAAARGGADGAGAATAAGVRGVASGASGAGAAVAPSCPAFPMTAVGGTGGGSDASSPALGASTLTAQNSNKALTPAIAVLKPSVTAEDRRHRDGADASCPNGSAGPDGAARLASSEAPASWTRSASADIHQAACPLAAAASPGWTSPVWTSPGWTSPGCWLTALAKEARRPQ
ncbi:hypothetical protein [Ramlibacter tataouinensis]|uniref:hypothetical protein n=1 Tax=Ramlibacter tataouinensis TaxID=94132 RepID=UPI0011AE39DB|nr:hypothetical protein [Ramlibacter tataouinensis]